MAEIGISLTKSDTKTCLGQDVTVHQLADLNRQAFLENADQTQLVDPAIAEGV